MLTKKQLSKFKEIFETKLKDPLLKNKELVVEKGNEAREFLNKK